MAYRFLLEVPEALAPEASIAIGEAGDAQVVVVRNSHARGLDEGRMDLTVAAHSLRVISTLYDWFDQLGASRPDIALVLHGGDRVTLESIERGAMVAAIRRDQPWVERTIPKIGEHETDSFSSTAQNADALAFAMANASTSSLERSWHALPAIEEPEGGRKIAIRELNHLSIRVSDIATAERYYVGFFSMDIVARARGTDDGGYRLLGADYSPEAALRAGAEADLVFLRNGPLVLALQRVGRGARLERGLLDHISIRVDATTFTAIKGQVLMRGMEVVSTAETAFAFRDPFGLSWEITLQSVPEFM